MVIKYKIWFYTEWNQIFFIFCAWNEMQDFSKAWFCETMMFSSRENIFSGFYWLLYFAEKCSNEEQNTFCFVFPNVIHDYIIHIIYILFLF